MLATFSGRPAYCQDGTRIRRSGRAQSTAGSAPAGYVEYLGRGSVVGTALTPPKPAGVSELLYQIQKFHGFLWASGGCFSDFLIHNIDESCWMKDAWPVSWENLIHAIRKDKMYNEVKRGAEASLVTAMGRMSAHTGQIITFEQMMNCKSEFAPDVDKLTMTSPAPLQMDKLTKRYPIPQPGIVRDREYLV